LTFDDFSTAVMKVIIEQARVGMIHETPITERELRAWMVAYWSKKNMKRAFAEF
jgi:hypothetical protein